MGDLSRKQPSFTVHLDHLNSTSMVKWFCGVIGQNGELVHDGDFVKLNSHYKVGITKFNDPYGILSSQLIEVNAQPFSMLLQMRYGILLTSCKTFDGSCVCIVQGLESMVSPDENPITNE